MKKQMVHEKKLIAFKLYLEEEERSGHTIEKYLRDVGAFFRHLGAQAVNRQAVISYKHHLEEAYAPASVNSMLAALNVFFQFCGAPELKVKSLKIQKNLFAPESRELSQAEYKRLVMAAKGQQNERLSLVMQTICSTGIRVSELQFITLEAVKTGYAEVSCKGKRRTVFLRPELRRLLALYGKKQGISTGSIFLSRMGNPLNRHKIWADMKALCHAAGVDASKVFPHNLRHLFARTFYAIEKDLGRLADILGHSSVNTTRVYTMDCGRDHMRLLRRMPLLL